jgi:hypothetical protein
MGVLKSSLYGVAVLNSLILKFGIYPLELHETIGNTANVGMTRNVRGNSNFNLYVFIT